MEQKVYLDATKGEDAKGSINNSEAPFKTFDVAYNAARSQSKDKIVIQTSGSDKQLLKLPEYVNVQVTGSQCIKVIECLSLENVEFNVPVIIEVPVTLKGDKLIDTKGAVKFTEFLTVVEASYNKNNSYPLLTLITNSGILETSGITIIKVNRMFTFINNNGSMKIKMPSVEYQGGDFFLGGSTTTSNIIYGVPESTPLQFKVNPGLKSGYLVNEKINNSFSWGRFKTNFSIENVNVNFILPDVGAAATVPLLISDVEPTELKDTTFTIRGSLVKSNTKVSFSNTNNFTKINTVLADTISIGKSTSRVKKITDNYVIDDIDGDMFHVDFSGNPGKIIQVTIPEDLVIGERELFFNKLNSHPNNKLQIKAKNIMSNGNIRAVHAGYIQLDHTKSQICLYKVNDIWYIKYLC